MSPLCGCEQQLKRSILIANSQAYLLERFSKTLKHNTNSLCFGIKIWPLLMAAFN